MTWSEELRAAGPDILDVAAALGLSVSRRRFGPCPACGARDDHHQPVTPRHGGSGWLCSRCKAHGDAIRLASWVVLGKDRATGSEWGSVRAALAGGGWCSADGQAGAFVAPAKRAPEPELAYPDSGELRDVLGACSRVVQSRAVTAWCNGRGFDPEMVPAGVLPGWDRWPEWWPYGGRPWSLVCSMVDGQGVIRSMHARAVGETTRGKTRWPYECRATGLLFADPWVGRPMLRGLAVDVDRVVVVEGITDYLALASRRPERTAVIGACSGGFGALCGARVARVPVHVATDGDATGERYAAEVSRALAGWDVRRVHMPVGVDVADALQGGFSLEAMLG